MKWLVFVLLWKLFLVLVFTPSQVQASSGAKIRALLPQPKSGEPEWVVIENSLPSASGAAVLRDTHGSVKAFQFALQADQPWYFFTASQSGLALNNDQDGLTLEVHGSVVDATPTYSSTVRDQVWTRLDSGWVWLTQTEFWRRQEEGDWSALSEGESSPTPTPTAAPESSKSTPAASSKSSQSTAFPALQSGEVAVSSQAALTSPQPTTYPGRPYTLTPRETTEFVPATSGAAETLAHFQEPNYQEQMRLYGEWLGWWRRAMWWWLVSLLCWCGLAAPLVIKTIARRTARRWRWPLL